MSHVTDKRLSPCGFPVMFATVAYCTNLSSFRLFLLRDSLLFSLLLARCMGSYVGKI